MKDKTVLAAIIIGVCLIISSYLLSSGMKSLSQGISNAGTSVGNGIANTGHNMDKLTLSLSGGNTPIRIENVEK